MWPSHWEILIIFIVILLLFGAKRIPEMARGLGKGIREFRSAVKDVQEEVDTATRSDAGRSNVANTIAPAAAPGQVARDGAGGAATTGEKGASPAPEEARS